MVGDSRSHGVLIPQAASHTVVSPFLGSRKFDSKTFKQLQTAFFSTEGGPVLQIFLGWGDMFVLEMAAFFSTEGGPVLQIFLGWGDMFVLEMGSIQRASSPKCWEKWSRHCLTPRLHRVSLWWPIAGAPAAFRQEATSKTWSGSWYVEIRIWISRLLLPHHFLWLFCN